MTPHKIEELFKAPVDDIMDAILRGFRAQVDVKGKLAELYLSKQLEDLKRRREIDRYEWFDKDGVPDFHVFVGEIRLVIECKNVRSPAVNRAGTNRVAKVELQKTRNGIDVEGRRREATLWSISTYSRYAFSTIHPVGSMSSSHVSISNGAQTVKIS